MQPENKVILVLFILASLLIGYLVYSLAILVRVNDCLTTPITEVSEQCRNLIYKGDM